MNEIDRVLTKVSYGLYVVSAKLNDKNYGCIINTFSQVTAKSPIVTFSINKDNASYRAIKESKKFGISILSESTNPLVIGKFGFYSSDNVDKFKDFKSFVKFDIPFIAENCCGYLYCDALQFIDAKSHVIVVAQTKEGLYTNNFKEMTYRYYHDVIKGKAPDRAPTFNSNFKEKEEIEMSENVSYICTICGYVYEGDLTQESDDYVCPICGAGKEAFEKQ